MFAMYDDDGLNFRTTLDNLYAIKKVQQTNSINEEDQHKKHKEQQEFDELLYHRFHHTHIANDTNQYKQLVNIHEEARVYHVRDIMTTNVYTVKDTSTIEECYEIMKQYDIKQLPIIADMKLHLKGIIFLDDIFKFVMENKNNIFELEQNIMQIATNKVITTDPISDIRRVAKVMLDFDQNAIPVVDSKETLIGIVAKDDILKAVATIPHIQMWA
jgi:CBS domain-containing protein